MARRLKPAGKFAIACLVLLAAFFLVKNTTLLEKIFPGKSTSESTVPQLDDMSSTVVSGTTVIRLAHWTWNTHQGWALANKGKQTAPDSIFANNGITMQFKRMENIPDQIAALKLFAKRLKSGEANPKEGVHYFTVMGDAGAWVLRSTMKAMEGLGSDYQPEVIGFGGFSFGEDKFMGLPAWKKNPQSAKGALVAGVPADGDWNILILWCAQNGLPYNSDKRYYDPGAVNFLETDDYIQAGDVYIAGKPVELVFKANGKDYEGKPVEKGDKGKVAINGTVTWTPVDKSIADKKGGLVSIVSTREYSNQMPQFIIGVKKWNRDNKETVVKMLASIFKAADLINKSDRDLKQGTIAPRSAQDYRWQGAKYVQEIFESENPDYWYTYFSTVSIRDKQGLNVEIGGSSVSNLSRNIRFFGLDGSTDIGGAVYNRFAKLAMQFYPDRMEDYPEWASVFNPDYIKGVWQDYSDLARSDPNLPSFTAGGRGAQMGEMTFRIPFDSGKASFTGEANKVLKEALEQLVIAANSKVEIHGHTDSQGDPGSNMSLSKLRGDAVFAWMREKGGASFPTNRVKIVPHGQNELLVPDQVEGQFLTDKMALNRRVVIKIFKN